MRMALIAVVALGLAACSGGESVEDGGSKEPVCMAESGEYPPETIVITGMEQVDVPYTSWSCPGYDSDRFADEFPFLKVGATGEVSIDGEFRDDPSVEIRARTPVDQVSVDGEIDGESLAFQLPAAAEHLWVRVCTKDGRCANYEADVGTTEVPTTTSSLDQSAIAAQLEIDGRLPDGRGYLVSFTPIHRWPG